MEKVPPKQKKIRGATKEELLNFDKEKLIDIILQLETHNAQLKNIISRNLNDDIQSDTRVYKKPFDFAKCHYRKVLFKFLYFGWDYQGLAIQEDTNQTIEHHLFHALTKSCLIQSRETANYHRCGRTDKGVSAYGQVISITIRSKFPPEQQSDPELLKTEMPYCKILNRLLPKEIRMVAWMPIPDGLTNFSARFDCKQRKYKYYFPRSNLDLPAMRIACSKIIGSHDFRHLCKMDVGNGVVEFIRHINSAAILPVDDKDCDLPTSMYSLIIEGNAFLWHQIRCIMGVLLLVGQGLEKPEVFDQLLDVESNPRKPQYNMALDIPLNLFHCEYEIEDTNKWVCERDEMMSVVSHLQNQWSIHSVKTTMIKDCLQDLETKYNAISNSEIFSHIDCLTQGVKPKVYTPLLKRQTCSSLEERIEHFKKKRNIPEKENNEDLK
ncbi:hypothetical protein K1T71_000895 [Dendrolimus kikuchii]|uniref:Uncharacterized protein n=1 Tax=Dendrolimus kikuchii TaxID=765133 RepID=A0ACC1DGN2_9NEOP|nr:hypothetical protein K1T71_000895 [Dendrolimus kikuchii]